MDRQTVGIRFRKTVASVCFIGYCPASGTVASAAVIAALWFAAGKTFFTMSGNSVAYWFMTLGVIGFSFYFSSRSR